MPLLLLQSLAVGGAVLRVSTLLYLKVKVSGQIVAQLEEKHSAWKPTSLPHYSFPLKEENRHHQLSRPKRVDEVESIKSELFFFPMSLYCILIHWI